MSELQPHYLSANMKNLWWNSTQQLISKGNTSLNKKNILTKVGSSHSEYVFPLSKAQAQILTRFVWEFASETQVSGNSFSKETHELREQTMKSRLKNYSQNFDNTSRLSPLKLFARKSCEENIHDPFSHIIPSNTTLSLIYAMNSR